ncbi:MAG: hypothetical protein ACJ8FD_06065, partial [Bradyrhizobium canariense]
IHAPQKHYADIGRNSKVVFCNFLDMKLFPSGWLSKPLDLTARASPPKFGTKGPTRILSISA